VDDVAGGDGVGGVDFSDEEKANAWLEKQTDEIRYALTARAALRSCPNLNMLGQSRFPSLALPLFRVILLYALRGSGKVTHSDWLDAKVLTAQSVAATVADATQRGSQDWADLFSGGLTVPIISGSTYAIAKSCDNATAFTAATKDSAQSSTHVYSVRLWHDLKISDKLEENHKFFVQRLKKDRATWGFWHDWYLAMWEGRFTDWDLAVEVAKIPDEVWEQGAEAVADAIRGIEARRASALPRPENVPELERSTLLKYVEKLLANPDMTALAADGAAQTLRQAISTYLRDAPANALPDELAHLEGLPALFDGIATLAKSGGKSEAKARQMADQIEALNAKIARLEAQLKEARTKTVNGLFTQNMLRAAGTAFGAGAVATLGLSVRHFFGEWPDEFTLENLRGFLIDLQTATPIDGNTASLPPATDV